MLHGGKIKERTAVPADWMTRCVTPVVSADELPRQYYDTADPAYGPTMAATNYIPEWQILFGTDYPFLRIQTNAMEITDRGLSAEDMRALQRGNVTALMPQLAN